MLHQFYAAFKGGRVEGYETKHPSDATIKLMLNAIRYRFVYY